MLGVLLSFYVVDVRQTEPHDEPIAASHLQYLDGTDWTAECVAQPGVGVCDFQENVDFDITNTS